MRAIQKYTRVYVKYVDCCRQCPNAREMALNGKVVYACSVHPIAKSNGNIIVTIRNIDSILDDCPLKHARDVDEVAI